MYTNSELATLPKEIPISMVKPQSDVIFQVGFTEGIPMYIVAQVQTYSLIGYFIVTWTGTILLIRHHLKRVGKVRFWILVTLPLIFFTDYYLTLYESANPTSPVTQSISSNLAVQCLVYAWIVISCGVLFGIAFRSVARYAKENKNPHDYMIIASQKELELLDDIGTAQSQQIVEKSVATTSEQLTKIMRNDRSRTLPNRE